MRKNLWKYKDQFWIDGWSGGRIIDVTEMRNKGSERKVEEEREREWEKRERKRRKRKRETWRNCYYYDLIIIVIFIFNYMLTCQNG